jgi:hypothetical protein
MVILLVVVSACLLSVNGLKREVTQLVERTLPGLQYAAKASALAADGYVCCLNLASSSPATNLTASVDEIQQITRQTDVYMEKYRDTIFDKDDDANFAKVQQVRDVYLSHRDQLLALLQAQRQADAVDYLKATVAPAYNEYSQSLNHLFEHKAKLGEARREQVMFLSVLTPIVVGILYVLLFILGLLVSFKIYTP